MTFTYILLDAVVPQVWDNRASDPSPYREFQGGTQLNDWELGTEWTLNRSATAKEQPTSSQCEAVVRCVESLVDQLFSECDGSAN